MSDIKMPEVLRKNVGMSQAYKLDNGTYIYHKINIKFGEDRVWVCADLDEDGIPILKFSHFNMKNPPRLVDKNAK